MEIERVRAVLLLEKPKSSNSDVVIVRVEFRHVWCVLIKFSNELCNSAVMLGNVLSIYTL